MSVGLQSDAMTAPSGIDAARPDKRADEHASIMRLCRDVSVEMTFHDTAQLEACRALLPAGNRIFVSHLPRQQSRQTVNAAVAVRSCGFTPVPHVSARQLADERALDQLLEELVRRAGVDHLLLVAGDRAQPKGPFASVMDVLRTGFLERHAIRHMSVAGHPEGHPLVSADTLRASELDKVQWAERAGIELSFMTQFAFDSAPIVQWARALRARGIRCGVRVGLAGPARPATLLQYAVRCGVGPSIRALAGRTASFGRLLGERGPESLVRELARAHAEGLEIDGIHLYSFGGLVRTCRWAHAVSRGAFVLDPVQGFVVEGLG